MIEITQIEFEDKVRDIISGKTNRARLIKELKIDRVTLNNKIQELSVYNPELYVEFIKKFPYKPREYTHIDWRAMLIDIMKKGYTKEQAAEQYEINSRTIARKVYKVDDNYIVDLYREVSGYRKRQQPLPQKLQEIVDDLPEEEVFIGGVYDKKEQELMELDKNYNAKLADRINVTGASAICGKERVSKSLNTLYRIKIERNTLEQNTQSSAEKQPDDSGEER